jgi:hypothetical protein
MSAGCGRFDGHPGFLPIVGHLIASTASFLGRLWHRISIKLLRLEAVSLDAPHFL